MTVRHLYARGAVTAAVVITSLAAACAPLGGILDDTVGYPASDQTIHGEVRSISGGRIQVREEYGGTRTVRYDNRTRVRYRQRDYPVSHLERGDYVRMRVSYDRNDTPWVDYIEVRESARDGRGRDRDRVARIERLDGTISRIDTRRGYFTLERSRSSTVTVRITGNTRRDDVRRFERLRRGDRVRVEVRTYGRNDVELIRFR